MTVMCVQYYRTWACFYIIEATLTAKLYVYATSIGWGLGWGSVPKTQRNTPRKVGNMTKPLHVKNQPTPGADRPTRNNKQLPNTTRKIP